MNDQDIVDYQVRDRVAEITMRREPVNAINMALTRAVNARLSAR
jgi:enoyl-CoA hydratase/carnithine racemase